MSEPRDPALTGTANTLSALHREVQSLTTGTFCVHRVRPGADRSCSPLTQEHKVFVMTIPTRFAKSMLALAAAVSTLTPFAAQAASYPTSSLQQLQYNDSSFTVLSAAAGSQGAVTCTDSTIMGNVGSSGAQPAMVQTRCSISGNVVAPVTSAVLAQFNNHFDTIKNQVCQKQLSGTLAGVTLAPGVYCFAAAAALTGTVTLNGPATGVWVIKVAGSLTGNSFSMVMAGNAKPCNVYLESSGATTMTTSNAKGNFFSGEAITLTGGSFVGRAFAKQSVTTTNIAVTGCTQ
jgi:hypothetical protein